MRQRGAGRVHKVAALGADVLALAVERAQAIDRVEKKVLVKDNVVVIKEDHHVMAHDGGHRKAQILDGAVAAEGHGLPHHVGQHPPYGGCDMGRLLLANDQRVQVLMRAADGVHAGAGGLLAGRGCHHQNDDPDDAAHLLK